ncbi:MAG: hypothetical protein ACJ8KU_02185 [Chthoniobacterales bacterium]
MTHVASVLNNGSAKMGRLERTQKQISQRYWSIVANYSSLYPWKLARIAATAVAIIGGILAIVIFYRQRASEEFFNAGRISAPHAKFGNDCKQCHEEAAGAPDRPQLIAALKERFHSGVEFNTIDRKCEVCHQQHTLHEPNVVENRSCSACHMEHQGSRSLRIVATSQCAACHNNAAVMEASAEKGAHLPADAFHIRPHPPQQFVFDLPRPARGYTQVFPTFADKHPEFQVISEKARDPDVLRFNHQRHLSGADIPQVNGKKLDCEYCHKPDVEGRFMQRVTFTANCQACHSLQFDIKNPEMQLPHGDATAVRGYLHSLPTHYADLALTKGITAPAQIQSFVAQQVAQLRDQVRSGEELERRVFFTVDPYKPQAGVVGTRAAFYGCAFCHEVKPQAALVPAVTKPAFADRWMPQAHFNHAKHQSVKCDECHHATQSRETSDVLMPAKANCVICHSPAGKIASECMVCHTYHAPRQIAAAAPSPTPRLSFKEMVRDAVARR